MARCIVDSCVIVNLYAGWGDLTGLRAFSHEWFVCDAVAREVQYVRDFDTAGNRILQKLDFQASIDAGLLVQCRPESSGEIQSNVDFAVELDDGEAQALALAQHRKMVLVTDEKPALRIAARSDVSVQTVTTPILLKEWASLDPTNESQLKTIIQRIASRAQYTAPRESPLFNWWHGY